MDSLTLLNTTSLLGYEETTDTDSDFTGFKDSQLFDSNMSFIRKFYHGRNYSQRVIIDIGIELRITFHALIFILAVTGNTLVISVLAQNKRMRTVTNVFLLNLAISDLLLAVFCIPFTLIPVILKNFIFGAVMCVLVRYLQGKQKIISPSVDVLFLWACKCFISLYISTLQLWCIFPTSSVEGCASQIWTRCFFSQSMKFDKFTGNGLQIRKFINGNIATKIKLKMLILK